MPYEPQEWIDGPGGHTPIDAAHLTHMEEGIAAASRWNVRNETGDCTINDGDLIRIVPVIPDDFGVAVGGCHWTPGTNTITCDGTDGDFSAVQVGWMVEDNTTGQFGAGWAVVSIESPTAMTVGVPPGFETTIFTNSDDWGSGIPVAFYAQQIITITGGPTGSAGASVGVITRAPDAGTALSTPVVEASVTTTPVVYFFHPGDDGTIDGLEHLWPDPEADVRGMSISVGEYVSWVRATDGPDWWWIAAETD